MDAAGVSNVQYLLGFKYVIYGIAALAVVNKIYLDIHGLGPLIEWTMTFILMNFFVFLNLFNNYYDSVHAEGKLVN